MPGSTKYRTARRNRTTPRSTAKTSWYHQDDVRRLKAHPAAADAAINVPRPAARALLLKAARCMLAGRGARGGGGRGGGGDDRSECLSDMRRSRSICRRHCRRPAVSMSVQAPEAPPLQPDGSAAAVLTLRPCPWHPHVPPASMLCKMLTVCQGLLVAERS